MTDKPMPNTPLRLADAVKHAFPFGGMTVSGLRKEADRGRLKIERIAGKDFTTLSAIEEMRELCRVPAQPKVAPRPSLPPAATPAHVDGHSIATEALFMTLSARGAQTAMDEARSCSPEQVASRLRKREVEVLERLAAADRPIQFREVSGGPATMALLFARGFIAADAKSGQAFIRITSEGRAALP